MKFLKGQGSSEYLVLLAVVLIVALVGVTLLGGFTGMGNDARATESKNYWTGAVRPFTVPEWSQRGTQIYLTIQNNEPDRILVTNISLNDGPDVAVLSPASGMSFIGGARRTVNFTAPKACDAESYDFFEYNLNITYNTGGIVGKTQHGAKPLSGRCIVE